MRNQTTAARRIAAHARAHHHPAYAAAHAYWRALRVALAPGWAGAAMARATANRHAPAALAYAAAAGCWVGPAHTMRYHAAWRGALAAGLPATHAHRAGLLAAWGPGTLAGGITGTGGFATPARITAAMRAAHATATAYAAAWLANPTA